MDLFTGGLSLHVGVCLLIVRRDPNIPFCFNLNIQPSRHTLSKDLGLSVELTGRKPGCQ